MNIQIITRDGRDFVVDPETGKQYPAISGGAYAAAIAAVAAVVIAAAGTAYSMYASQQQAAAQQEAMDMQAEANERNAQQARNAAEYQAKLREQDAEVSERATAVNQGIVAREATIIDEGAARDAAVTRAQATYSQDATAANIRDLQRKGDIITGAGRALIGGSGVTTEGSPLLAMMDTQNQLDLEVSREQIRGSREADALIDQSALITADGRLRSTAAREEAQRIRFGGDVQTQAYKNEAILTRYAGATRSAGYLDAAAANRFQGQIYQQAGTQASIGAGIKGAGTILTAAAPLYSSGVNTLGSRGTGVMYSDILRGR